jgi:hypothetical protein
VRRSASKRRGIPVSVCKSHRIVRVVAQKSWYLAIPALNDGYERKATCLMSVALYNAFIFLYTTPA